MATMYAFLFIAVTAIVLAVVLSKNSPSLICGRCGFIGQAKTRTGGSFALEILLWLMFLLPGLIYSLVRSGSRSKVCAKCGSPELIPLDSPNGRLLAAKAGQP